MSTHCAIACGAHPFASDWGATCILRNGHTGGHQFMSAWLADRHTSEVSDD